MNRKRLVAAALAPTIALSGCAAHEQSPQDSAQYKARALTIGYNIAAATTYKALQPGTTVRCENDITGKNLQTLEVKRRVGEYLYKGMINSHDSRMCNQIEEQRDISVVRTDQFASVELDVYRATDPNGDPIRITRFQKEDGQWQISHNRPATVPQVPDTYWAQF